MQSRWYLFLWLTLIAVYLATHLVGLTALPVFADEAIYIRWAQLIIEEPARYAFFPLNDGKTPLFIWILVPALKVVSDPLLAARMVAVMVGLLQLGATALLVRALGGRRRAMLIAALLVTVLPYWYFHHRMALMDGLLTLWLTLVLWSVVKLVQVQVPNHLSFSLMGVRQLWRDLWRWPVLRLLLLGGLFLGLALWSKLPAAVFVPATVLFVFLPKVNWQSRVVLLVRLGVILLFGVALFLLLKLHPAFGQLFSRGGDFLFSISEVLGGAWKETIPSTDDYLGYFFAYLSPGVFFLSLAGLFLTRERQTHAMLLLATLAFLLPIALMGKVVFPRYLLPGAITLTVSAALALSSYIDQLKQQALGSRAAVLSVALALLVSQIMTTGAQFILYSLTNPGKIPFVSADVTQYLSEWSAGYGVREAADLLLASTSQERRIAVATEGYFGTLPDALLMYFHRRDVSNLMIEGIGQPVRELPAEFLERARSFDETWLIVNSHRLTLSLPEDRLIAEYCRPVVPAPCLQVWNVTALVQSSSAESEKAGQ